MKRIMLVAILASVSACSKGEPAPAPEATEEVAEAAPATTAADGGASTGIFAVTLADGTRIVETVKEGGTYETKDAEGKVIETGTWVQKSPELYCSTKDEEGAEEVCRTESIGEDGVWTSTGPDGDTVTVERVEG